MIDRVPDELWMEVRDIVQETGIKTIPKKKKCKKTKQKQKNDISLTRLTFVGKVMSLLFNMLSKFGKKKCKNAKWLPEEALQIAVK